MTIEIRTARDDELRAFIQTVTTSFLERPANMDMIEAEVREVWELSRTWLALDEGRPCGTLRSWASELTLPGRDRVPAAAVAGVSVLPSHRRRGILRRMIAAEHAAARERGEVVAILYASEYPIYGRFGYGPAVQQATWSVDASATGFHGAPPQGTVELATPSVEWRDTIRGVFDAWRLRQVGEIRRRDFTWDFDLALRPDGWGEDWKGFLAVHRDPSGTVDGYVRYSAESRWERRQPRNTTKVDELHALTDDAYVALWRFLIETDWVVTVRAEQRPPDERLPWLLTNARAAAIEEQGDGLWLRLLDVPRALAARRYEREGRLVLEIVDPEAPGGRQRIELDGGPAGATAAATDRDPDLTLPIAAVGAAYLGGARLRHAVLVTGVDEHRPGALDEADRMFATHDPPWCSTHF